MSDFPTFTLRGPLADLTIAKAVTHSSAAAGAFANTAVIATTDTDGDPGNDQSSASVTVPNVAPVADADGFTVAEDSSGNTLDVLDGDTDANGDPLVVDAVGAPDQEGAAGNAGTHVTYTPALNFNGTETFTYTVADGQGGYDTATVSVTVTNVNDAPVAQDDAYATAYETPLVVDAANGVLDNDTDVDSALTTTRDSGPDHGTLDLALDGSFVYTPTAGFSGQDSFVYVASDGALTDTATVVIDVGAVSTYTLTVAVDGAGSGTVSPTAGDHVYDAGTVVTLTATADAGSEFAGWSGALSGTASPITLTMNADQAVTATFDLVPTYTLTIVVSPTEGGTVTLSPSGGVYEEGTVVELTPNPAADYTFVGWSGDAGGSTTPLYITVTQNLTITANFEQSLFWLYLPLGFKDY